MVVVVLLVLFTAMVEQVVLVAVLVLGRIL
jgi:hypothetical protein